MNNQETQGRHKKNHSYFFIPFKVKDISAWMKHMEGESTKEGQDVWRAITKTVSCHLMKFVDESVGYQAKGHFAYELVHKQHYGFPFYDKGVELLRCAVKSEGGEQEYEIYVRDIKAHCFGTGIGFLVYDVWYSKGMSCDDIITFNYAFKKMADNKVKIKTKNEGEQIDWYFYDLSHKLVDDSSNNVHIFFDARKDFKKQCRIFSIFCDEKELSDNTSERQLFSLCHGYNLEHEYNLASVHMDFQSYHPYSYIHWGYCQEGIACIYNDEREFTKNGYGGNLQSEYYFMYLILLHQRYAALSLVNDMMRCGKDNLKDWKQLKYRLLQYNIEYSFPMVSDEMPYYKLYQDMRNWLLVDKFEDDLKDVTERMYLLNKDAEDKKEEQRKENEQKEIEYRHWTMELVMGLLAVIAAISVLADGAGFIHILLEDSKSYVNHWLYWVLYAVTAGIVFIVVIFLIINAQRCKKFRLHNKRKSL